VLQIGPPPVEELLGLGLESQERQLLRRLVLSAHRARRERVQPLEDLHRAPPGRRVKGLRKALGGVFGDAALIQRCQLHKGRNLDALVPTARQAYVRAALRQAYRATSIAGARRQLTALATWLERNGHADAASSVREGLEETLTVLKLGLPPALRRFFATTNCIENLIGTLRHVTRNIKRWRDGDMRRRWLGLGLLRAAERFRRIKRHGALGVLVTALAAGATAERAA
jgi:transposase-like protein